MALTSMGAARMDVSRKGRNAGGGVPGAWMIWRIEGCLPTRNSRYYYDMSGQMKTLLDRANPLYGGDYHFIDIYLLTSAAEDEEHVPSRAISGLEGWIECLDRAHLAGTVFAGGVTAPGEITGHPALAKALSMGQKV